MRANERGHDIGRPWLLTRVLTVEGHDGFSGATPYRAELFRQSYVLTFRSATQHQSLIEALHYIQRFQHVRRDHLPYEISLDFASIRWQALIRTRHNMQTVLNRRQLEVCVFHYLDHGLRCGDVYVEGSAAYADYRQQLLPWDKCAPRVPAYCQALQFAPTGGETSLPGCANACGQRLSV